MRSIQKMFLAGMILLYMGLAGSVAWGVEEGRAAATVLKASGEIASVDVQSGRLTLKAKAEPGAQPTSFVVDPTAVVSKGQQSLKLTDLKAGDPVTVEYTRQGTSNIVSSVIVQAPGAEKAPAASSAQ